MFINVMVKVAREQHEIKRRVHKKLDVLSALFFVTNLCTALLQEVTVNLCRAVS